MHGLMVAPPIEVDPLRIPQPFNGGLELLAAGRGSPCVNFGWPGRDEAGLAGLGTLRKNANKTGIMVAGQADGQGKAFGGPGTGIEMNEKIAERHGFLAKVV
jgi:hypothetical protein